MLSRLLVVLFASAAFAGCLQVLGDYDLTGTDPDPTETSSTSGGSIPCWFRSADGFCACQDEAPTAEYVSATSCQPLGYPSSGKCCGFDGWPENGTCLCAPVRCLAVESNPDSCVCAIYPPSEGFTEESYCSAAPCCARAGACGCGGDPCDVGETEVPSCDVDEVAASVECGDGGTEVSACR